MCDPVVAQLMRGLVSKLGGQLAAAHVTAQARGVSPDPADISRKMNGTREWTITDMQALQQATGKVDVTEYLNLSAEATAPTRSLSASVAAFAKEGGEAVSAALSLTPDASEDELALAEKEAREAHREAAEVLAAIQAKREAGAVPIKRAAS